MNKDQRGQAEKPTEGAAGRRICTCICSCCGHENPEGSHHCQACGGRLIDWGEVICPACGAELMPGFRFCGYCGAKL